MSTRRVEWWKRIFLINCWDLRTWRLCVRECFSARRTDDALIDDRTNSSLSMCIPMKKCNNVWEKKISFSQNPHEKRCLAREQMIYFTMNYFSRFFIYSYFPIWHFWLNEISFHKKIYYEVNQSFAPLVFNVLPQYVLIFRYVLFLLCDSAASKLHSVGQIAIFQWINRLRFIPSQNNRQWIKCKFSPVNTKITVITCY